jgi:hypothetical protein
MVSDVTLQDKRMKIAERNYRLVGPNIAGRISDYKKILYVHFERKEAWD